MGPLHCSITHIDTFTSSIIMKYLEHFKVKKWKEGQGNNNRPDK
jgi:hypothetical protein